MAGEKIVTLLYLLIHLYKYSFVIMCILCIYICMCVSVKHVCMACIWASNENIWVLFLLGDLEGECRLSSFCWLSYLAASQLIFECSKKSTPSMSIELMLYWKQISVYFSCFHNWIVKCCIYVIKRVNTVRNLSYFSIIM